MRAVPPSIPNRGLLLALFLLTGFVEGRAPEPSAGLVTEAIEPGTTAAKAGLEPGDVLVSWTTEAGAAGTLRTPFDLATVFVEEVPRRTVTLAGTRGGQPAPLMAEFYAQIKAGKSKDEALRNAQIRQLQAASGKGPFGWAAFQLYGDWN